MADTKRKRRDDGNRGRENSRKNKFKKPKSSNPKSQLKNGERRKKSGPRLPSSLQKEIERLNPTTALNSDEEIASDAEIFGKDVYEYDEEHAEEESQKNKRYDQVQVDKDEYELSDELSDDFKVSNNNSFFYFFHFSALVYSHSSVLGCWVFYK